MNTTMDDRLWTRDFKVFMVVFWIVAILAAGMARSAWAAEEAFQGKYVYDPEVKGWKKPGSMIIHSKEPVPITTKWLGWYICEKPKDAGDIFSVISDTVNGPCKYELGLRSDGVVVWRKVEEKEGVK